MNDTETPNEDAQSPGGSGGFSIRPQGRADTKLLELAVRERWPIPEEHRGAIIQRQVDTATDSEVSPREATSAARCLVSMEAQNIDVMLKTLDKLVPDQHEITHNVGEQVRKALEDIEGDERFEELSREFAIGEHARWMGNGSEPARLAAGEAPTSGRSSNNGHAAGSNGSANSAD